VKKEVEKEEESSSQSPITSRSSFHQLNTQGDDISSDDSSSSSSPINSSLVVPSSPPIEMGRAPSTKVKYEFNGKKSPRPPPSEEFTLPPRPPLDSPTPSQESVSDWEWESPKRTVPQKMVESSPQSLSQSASQNMYAALSEDDDDVDEIMEEYGEEEGNLPSVYTSHIPPTPDSTPRKKKSSKARGKKKKRGEGPRRNRRKDSLEESDSEKIPSSKSNKDSVSPQHDNEDLKDISHDNSHLSTYHDEQLPQNVIVEVDGERVVLSDEEMGEDIKSSLDLTDTSLYIPPDPDPQTVQPLLTSISQSQTQDLDGFGIPDNEVLVFMEEEEEEIPYAPYPPDNNRDIPSSLTQAFDAEELEEDTPPHEQMDEDLPPPEPPDPLGDGGTNCDMEEERATHVVSPDLPSSDTQSENSKDEATSL